MDKTNSIRRVFDFLIEHAQAGKLFSIEQLSTEAGWDIGETQENIRVRLSDLIDQKGDKYFAKPEILRVRLDDFNELLYQKKRLFTDYTLEVSPSILIYEFFMPLSREDRLREALDNLFYRDAIEHRILEIGIQKIRDGLKLPADYSEDQIHQFVFDFIENTIGGYSIYLVNGRYRADTLATRGEVVTRPFAYGPYIKERADIVSWLFLNFFAEAIIRVVQKEDEIWLLESGMRSAFYRFPKIVLA